ncbi:type II toxin-antitoxin system VapC family toxin [Nonomuraea sp. CA-143628]|uniref:type II toxin-antitoxin system VapC family toxin n=1 Tax=Nonomuraea sp. CA-143628 TaxID=3239997 RepID=UPI003D93E84A
MLVIDASVMINALADDGEAGRAARKAIMTDPAWIAPAHMPSEVAHVVSRLVRQELITQTRGWSAFEALTRAEIELADIRPLLPRIWELRGNIKAYDAAYVALAEAEGCTLITGDAKLANLPVGIGCDIRLV